MDALDLNSSNADSIAPQLLPVARSDRWQVHYRLQDLEISCRCLTDGSLEMTTPSFAAQIQVWSVLYQLRASRSQLIHLLERSWAASA